jgi:hypothetical protein
VSAELAPLRSFLFSQLRSHMALPTQPSPPDIGEGEMEQFRKRILMYIRARVYAGERYNESRLARDAGLSQQTLNDLLRGKTMRVSRLTRTKITDFMENNPAPSNTTMASGSATALMMLSRNGPQIALTQDTPLMPVLAPTCVLPPISQMLDYAYLPRP